MKIFVAASLFFVSSVCSAQQWQAEIMASAASYNGDLNEKALTPRAIRPAVSVNVKYEFYYLVIRAGLSWTKLAGNDDYNKDIYLKNRNLSFQSNIWEASVCAELNLYEPDIFWAYPYLFAGVGVFKHNPYAPDNEGKKTYLQPLHTEGQGWPELKDRKEYKLTQFCVPVGLGWKFKLNDKFDIAYEFGYRLLFTDYLDDVSTTYVNPQLLVQRDGPKALEMSNRATAVNGFVPKAGDQRGNPDIKDSYYFSGVKLIMKLGKKTD